MPKKPIRAEILEEAGVRYVALTYADGSYARHPVDSDATPRRKPRKPVARVRIRSRDEPAAET
ncbi:MAG: hypothetical protein JO000_28795 [Alphaproteobacteria bacterium]|nr:hypothetical protein [Alphaproteobacteria bacterium]